MLHMHVISDIFFGGPMIIFFWAIFEDFIMTLGWKIKLLNGMVCKL